MNTEETRRFEVLKLVATAELTKQDVQRRFAKEKDEWEYRRVDTGAPYSQRLQDLMYDLMAIGFLREDTVNHKTYLVVEPDGKTWMANKWQEYIRELT